MTKMTKEGKLVKFSDLQESGWIVTKGKKGNKKKKGAQTTFLDIKEDK